MSAPQTIAALTGTRYPLIQGGMAWVSDASLAAAVSEAGGLGVIAAGNAPPEWVREQVQKLRAKTDKPFGLNVMLLSPYVSEIADLVCELRVPVVIMGADFLVRSCASGIMCSGRTFLATHCCAPAGLFTSSHS